MRRSIGLVGGLAFAFACASAAAALAAGRSATTTGAAPASQRLDLVLPLAADDAGLQRFALAVTTPGSPQFGRYESIAELAGRFGAGPGERSRVVGYLRGAGATGVTIDATGLFAYATVTARLAQRLFATPLARFHSARDGRFIAPTAAVKIPAALRGAVTGVVGLDTRRLGGATDGLRPLRHWPGRQRGHAAAGQPSSATTLTGTQAGCGAGKASGGFTPNQYLTAYNFTPLQSAKLLGDGERVALIEIDGFKDGDINAFAQCFGLGVPALNAFGVGVNKVLPPGPEATLDLEVLDATAPNLAAIDVYESKADAADTLKALTTPLQNPGFKPQVISASLGLCEAFTAQAVGMGGLRSTENALRMAAASGISFLASSGDAGSADCTDNNGVPMDQLAVNYPASSPWVTAVGGTNLTLSAANQIVRQVVWNDTDQQPGSAAGGGFSELFNRPKYQNGIVARNTRALPDVSMLADVAPGYAVFCSAQPGCVNNQNSDPWQTVGGTSAATPLLAGGLALIDQQLRTNGRQDVGFANPLLYFAGGNAQAASHVFQDVTQYGNDVGPYIPGNKQPLGCCGAGPGFDAASGWGSVSLGNLANVAMLFEPRVASVGLKLPAHQRPVHSHYILATVLCSDACSMAAFADVRIGQADPFEVDSSLFQLKQAGSLTIPIRFSGRQLAALRSGLRHGRRISAQVFAVTVVGGNVQKETRGMHLPIKS